MSTMRMDTNEDHLILISEDLLTHQILITTHVLIQPPGHWELHRKVRFPSLTEQIGGVWIKNFQILGVIPYPAVLYSPQMKKKQSVLSKGIMKYDDSN